MNNFLVRILLLTVSSSLLLSCNPTRSPNLEDLASGNVLAEFTEVSLIGQRDGARLPARIFMRAGSSQLELSLLFQIGVPTTLLEGTYALSLGETRQIGKVRSKSLTFLGGQSDHPNLGGVFELLDEAGTARYKVTVPTGEVRPR